MSKINYYSRNGNKETLVNLDEYPALSEIEELFNLFPEMTTLRQQAIEIGNLSKIILSTEGTKFKTTGEIILNINKYNSDISNNRKYGILRDLVFEHFNATNTKAHKTHARHYKNSTDFAIQLLHTETKYTGLKTYELVDSLNTYLSFTDNADLWKYRDFISKNNYTPNKENYDLHLKKRTKKKVELHLTKEFKQEILKQQKQTHNSIDIKKSSPLNNCDLNFTSPFANRSLNKIEKEELYNSGHYRINENNHTQIYKLDYLLYQIKKENKKSHLVKEALEVIKNYTPGHYWQFCDEILQDVYKKDLYLDLEYTKYLVHKNYLLASNEIVEKFKSLGNKFYHQGDKKTSEKCYEYFQELKLLLEFLDLKQHPKEYESYKLIMDKFSYILKHGGDNILFEFIPKLCSNILKTHNIDSIEQEQLIKHYLEFSLKINTNIDVMRNFLFRFKNIDKFSNYLDILNIFKIENPIQLNHFSKEGLKHLKHRLDIYKPYEKKLIANYIINLFNQQIEETPRNSITYLNKAKLLILFDKKGIYGDYRLNQTNILNLLFEVKRLTLAEKGDYSKTTLEKFIKEFVSENYGYEDGAINFVSYNNSFSNNAYIMHQINKRLQIKQQHYNKLLNIGGKHPIIYAIDQNIDINGVNPIKYALKKNIRIQGITADIYAVSNNIEIAGNNFIEYCINDKDDKTLTNIFSQDLEAIKDSDIIKYIEYCNLNNIKLYKICQANIEKLNDHQKVTLLKENMISSNSSLLKDLLFSFGDFNKENLLEYAIVNNVSIENLDMFLEFSSYTDNYTNFKENVIYKFLHHKIYNNNLFNHLRYLYNKIKYPYRVKEETEFCTNNDLAKEDIYQNIYSWSAEAYKDMLNSQDFCNALICTIGIETIGNMLNISKHYYLKKHDLKKTYKVNTQKEKLKLLFQDEDFYKKIIPKLSSETKKMLYKEAISTIHNRTINDVKDSINSHKLKLALQNSKYLTKIEKDNIYCEKLYNQIRHALSAECLPKYIKKQFIAYSKDFTQKFDLDSQKVILKAMYKINANNYQYYVQHNKNHNQCGNKYGINKDKEWQDSLSKHIQIIDHKILADDDINNCNSIEKDVLMGGDYNFYDVI